MSAAPLPALPPVTGVTGGIAGVEAQQAAIVVLADHLDDAADTARERAATGLRVAADPDLVASAPLSPVTFARAEAAVLAAATGPRGCLGGSLAWEAEACAVRGALALVLAADETARAALLARDYALGHAVGALAPAAVLGAVSALPGLVLADRLASRLGVVDPVLGAVGGVVGDLLEDQATSHPGVVQALFHGGGGLVDGMLGLPPLHPTTADGAEAVAGLYDDGRPAVRRLDPATLAALAAEEGVPVPHPETPPHDLASLVGTLGGVAGLSVGASSRLNGTLAVTSLRRPDGSTAHVVYLPGTDDLATTPASQDHDVRDMGTNLALVAGERTAYEQGVLEAMHEAGVGPDDPVLVVGHSQGGMVAAALAADHTPFHVTHVVTAGSPLAQVDLPGQVQTLSLENVGDVVPLTDGAPNRPTTGHVTVAFDAGGSGVVGHHTYDAYVAGAAAADASADPSVRAALGSLRADGFLDPGEGVRSSTQVFQVTRQ